MSLSFVIFLFFVLLIIVIFVALAMYFQKRQKPETPAWEARMNVGGWLIVPMALIGAAMLGFLMLFES